MSYKKLKNNDLLVPNSVAATDTLDLKQYNADGIQIQYTAQPDITVERYQSAIQGKFGIVNIWFSVRNAKTGFTPIVNLDYTASDMSTGYVPIYIHGNNSPSGAMYVNGNSLTAIGNFETNKVYRCSIFYIITNR